MLSFLKKIFGGAATVEGEVAGEWMKYVAAFAVIGAALFCSYEYGVTRGYHKGYQKAWDTQQLALNKLTDERNAEVKAQNDKITALEQAAADAMDKYNAAQKALSQRRDQVVVTYKKNNPKTAEATAWSPETVDAINQLLGAKK